MKYWLIDAEVQPALSDISLLRSIFNLIGMQVHVLFSSDKACYKKG